MIDDVCCTWRSLNHDQGAWGHTRTGLSASIFGADDQRITREALTFWREEGIAAWRQGEVQRIGRLVEEEKLSWTKECIADLLLPFETSKGGIGMVSREGEELEAPLERDANGIVGEKAWSAGKDSGPDGERISSDEEPKNEPGNTHSIGGLEVPAEPSDTQEMIDDAVINARRIRNFEAIEAQAKESGAIRLMFHAENDKRRLMRSISTASSESKQAHALFRRFLDKRAEQEQKKLEERRIASAEKERKAAKRKRKLLKKSLKVKSAQAKNAKLRIALKLKDYEAAEKQDKLDAAKAHFSPEDCGHNKKGGGDAKCIKARALLMQKLKELCDPLPPAMEGAWFFIRDWWAKEAGKRHGEAVGLKFCKEIGEIAKAMGKKNVLVMGATKAKVKADPAAFEKYVRALYEMAPKACGSITFS